jgi:hypothetical protein
MQVSFIFVLDLQAYLDTTTILITGTSLQRFFFHPFPTVSTVSAGISDKPFGEKKELCVPMEGNLAACKGQESMFF